MNKENGRILCECNQCESQVCVGRSTRWAHLKKYGRPTLLTQTFEEFIEKSTVPRLNATEENAVHKRHRQPGDGKKKATTRPLHDRGVTLEGYKDDGTDRTQVCIVTLETNDIPLILG